MTIKVLVKIKGKNKNTVMIHAYDEKANHAICDHWPRPGDEWEVQERDIEKFTDLLWGRRCLRCVNKLNKQAKPQTRVTSVRAQKVLDAWERWTGQPHKRSQA